MSYYARQIFDGTKEYEFRKSPLKLCDMNKKIYVYSAKEDKAIIGSFEVSDILKGSVDDILMRTGYNIRRDKQEIIDYFENSYMCYALKLENVQRFENPLTLRQMRRIDPEIQLPQYYQHIYPDSKLYEPIVNLDKTAAKSNYLIGQ